MAKTETKGAIVEQTQSKLAGIAGLDDYQEVSLESYFWRARAATSPLVGKGVGTMTGIETKFSRQAGADEEQLMSCIIVKLDQPASWKEADGKDVVAEAGSYVRVPSNNGQLREVHRRVDIALKMGKAMGLAIAFEGTRPTPKGQQNVYEYKQQPMDKWATLASIAPEMIGFSGDFEAPAFDVTPAPKQLGAGANGAA